MNILWRHTRLTTILFGEGALEALAAEVAKLKILSGLLVIDPVLKSLGFDAKMKDIFRATGMSMEVFSDIESNPHLSSIERGLEVYKERECGFVIGFGGGSAIDSAKAIGILSANPGPLQEYSGIDKYDVPPCPLFAVPTTAGTGSEVSWSTVFFDDRAQRKCSVRSHLHAPRIAALQPSLLYSLSPIAVASCGIDALSHAIESYVSKRATPITELHSLSSIRGIVKHLPALYTKPSDPDAAAGMLLASLNAGLAFLEGRVGIAHALSHPMEKLFHAAHGRSCACVLPAVMRFATPGAIRKYADISRIFVEENGILFSLGDERSLAESAADFVENFIHSLGLATRISVLNKGIPISEKQFEALVQDALLTGNHLTSPVVPDKEELSGLIKSIL